MINFPSLRKLRKFLAHPCQDRASRLVGIPSLLAVLLSHKGNYPADLLEVCQFLYDRGAAVGSLLARHNTDPPATLEQEDYTKVCLPLPGFDLGRRLTKFYGDRVLLFHGTSTHATEVPLTRS